MHLITGFAGTDHVTSANDGMRNAQIYGAGRFVFDTGEKFSKTVINNNTIRIRDGYGIMDGRFFEIPLDTYEDVTIESGEQARQRKDLICIRYAMDDTTGIETASLVVIKGTSSSSTPATPATNTGNILNGATIADFPIYEVLLDGFNIKSVTQKFSVVATTVRSLSSSISSLSTSITNEAKARADADKAEVTARNNAISAEATARNTAISNETKARNTAITNETKARNTALNSLLVVESKNFNITLSISKGFSIKSTDGTTAMLINALGGDTVDATKSGYTLVGVTGFKTALGGMSLGLTVEGNKLKWEARYFGMMGGMVKHLTDSLTVKLLYRKNN